MTVEDFEHDFVTLGTSLLLNIIAWLKSIHISSIWLKVEIDDGAKFFQRAAEKARFVELSWNHGHWRKVTDILVMSMDSSTPQWSTWKNAGRSCSFRLWFVGIRSLLPQRWNEMPRVDDDFSATQGLAKVFAQAGAIDQGFSQAWHSRSFKHSTKNQHTLCNHESKVVFLPLQKLWTQVLLRLIRFCQSGFMASIPPSLWHPESSLCQEITEEAVTLWMSFFLALWCGTRKCVIACAPWNVVQPGHGKDPNVASLWACDFDKVMAPRVHRGSHGFLQTLPEVFDEFSYANVLGVNLSWSNGLNRALLGMCQASPHLLESLVMDSVRKITHFDV